MTLALPPTPRALGRPMAKAKPNALTPAEAGAYFKALRGQRKLRLRDVVEGTTVPNEQYLSALEAGRYNVLNSEHFPSLVRFFRLNLEEVERLKPDAVIVVSPTLEVAASQGALLPFPSHQVHPLAHGSEADTPLDPGDTWPVFPQHERPGMRLYRQDDDSMSASFPKGAVVLVDTDERRLADGRVYLIAHEGRALFRKYVETALGAAFVAANRDRHADLPARAVRVLGLAYHAYSAQSLS